MKEYWVNVYENKYIEPHSFHKWSEDDAVIYRLHAREFETREAKELYLKLKYGSKPIPKFKYNYDFSAKSWMD